jgi:hypothetical protein
MKKYILIFAIASTFAACKSNEARFEADRVGMVAGFFDQAVVSEKEVVVENEKAARTEGSYTSTSTNPAKVQKKGWSKAAKGAVIGGGAGAVAGAVISKKRVKGAVIGGVIGAGAGYIIGRSKDKKDGRVRN